MWDSLDAIRKQGFKALAIPHNGNASDGLMFAWLDSASGYIDRNYAERRQLNEPLSEISQNRVRRRPIRYCRRATSSPTTRSTTTCGDRRHAGRPAGSYLRDALSRGLVLQREVGVNPFKYGFVGASDLHSGLSVSAQADYAGSYYRPNIAAGRPSKVEAASILTEGSRRIEQNRPTTTGSLAGIWAENNTRESIYDALRRRETFATTGTRLKLRFFGGWDLTDCATERRELAASGVSARRADGRGSCRAPSESRRPDIRHLGQQGSKWRQPRPTSGSQGRWEDNGAQKERVFDVAWAGDGKTQSEDGHASPPRWRHS